MIDDRRDRKRIWKPIATVVTLGTTLPLLALLCLGRSPSPYDTANLPTWERRTPAPPKMQGKPACIPLPVSNIVVAGLPIRHQLLDADENRMFRDLETARGLPDDRLSAGKPGAWLEQAAVLGSGDAAMAAKLDRVCARLMNAQNEDGYLGAPAPVHSYTAADIAAHANNLRGLLAYYRLTHQPAAFYASLRAGDFLLNNYDPLPGYEQAGAEDALVFALVRLYQASGEPGYLRFAQREEATRGCDGLGLCALYEATGDAGYLRAAVKTWRAQAALTVAATARAAKRISPQFSAELFTITADPRYLRGLRAYRATDVWPLQVAYTRSASGLSVNCLYPATIKVGPTAISIAIDMARADPPIQGAGAMPPAKDRQTASISLSTDARTPALVHISFQPECLPRSAGASPEIRINGRMVALKPKTAARVVAGPLSIAASGRADSAEASLSHETKTAKFSIEVE